MPAAERRQPSAELDLSVVVVNWNAGDLLARCLASVPAASGGLRYEIVLVDNASSDGSVERVRREVPEARILAHDDNVGFGRGVAAGVAVAAGEFLAVVNPDVELDENSLRRLVSFLRRQGEAAALAGPEIRDADGGVHSGAERLPGVASAIAWVPGLARLYRRKRERLRRRRVTTRCDWVRGACMVLRRSALSAAGGFPTETFLYGEEMLIGLALRRRGFTCWYVPEVSVLHDSGSSAAQRWDEGERALRVREARILVMHRALSRPSFMLWNLIAMLGAALPRRGGDRAATEFAHRCGALHRRALSWARSKEAP